jgi:hypothetical protein
VLLIFLVSTLWQAAMVVVSLGVASTSRKVLEKEALSHLPSTNSGRFIDTRRNKQRLLVIAAVPRDDRHIWTLWSELECFTTNVDHVILSTPTWSRNITTKVMEEAKQIIPRFQDGRTTIEAQFYKNDRYDVGLWCDALEKTSLFKQYFEIGLLNDSIFALREYTAIFDALKNANISLSSLSYSYSAKNFRGGSGKEHFWVESVFRGLDKTGLQIFKNHSCLPADHPKFCHGQSTKEQKGCIVNNFEHDLASHFPEGSVMGFYKSDAPPETRVRPYKAKMSWASNALYWKKLVEEEAFPVAKENVKESIQYLDGHPLLQNCTKFLTTAMVQSWNLDFSIVEHTFEKTS